MILHYKDTLWLNNFATFILIFFLKGLRDWDSAMMDVEREGGLDNA